MLRLGHIGLRSVDGGAEDRMTRFTRDEQRMMMNLWCLFRSPLMFGGELRDNDEWTTSLLTNKEVLKVHREGSHPRPVTVGGELRIWCSDSPDGGLWVGLFNLTDHEVAIEVSWQSLGREGDLPVRELWSSKDLGKFTDGYSAALPPHGSTLVKVG